VAKALIDQLLQDKRMRFESILVRKDVYTFPVEISLKVIDYMGNKAILSILRDISKFKQMEKSI
jgi:PAS domain S-box-containing protein